MELQIGNRIAELRKLKGMTQEQLALELGISAPAISKWETDTSYPDITLLCPLARALGTNIDTLLKYQENLPKEKVAEYAEHIIKMQQELGVEKAEEQLQKLLHQYPNSIELKYHAAALLTNFAIQNTEITDADKQRWNQQKKQLLEEVYESKNIEYRPIAISSLAALELQENHLEQAEAFLNELPESSGDATGLWIQLYGKKGQSDKVIEILQKRMYLLVSQMLSCLAMMIEKAPSDKQKVLELCAIYKKLDEIFYHGSGSSDIILAEVYGTLGQEQEAASYLISYLESHAKEGLTPNPLLFAPTIKTANTRKENQGFAKKMMLRGIMADGVLAKLCELEEVQISLQKWDGDEYR